MAEDKFLHALESDFDNILLVDLDSGSIEVKHLSSKGQSFVDSNAISQGFESFVSFLSNKCIFPEDREWFCSTLKLENIRSLLVQERVHLLNHRVFTKNENTIYYQTKIARYYDDGQDESSPLKKFVFGGHSIDQVHRNDLREMEKESVSRHNAVIASLASEFDLICYVNPASKDVVFFHSTEFFNSIISKEESDMPPFKKLDFFFNNFIFADDYEKFRRETSYDRIKQELDIYPSYEVHFRAKISNDIFYYKVKFVPDEKMPGAYILGLLSFDEQVRSQIQRREQEKARQLMEKQLELMIVERTSEIQTKNKALNRINEDIIEMIGDITEARDLESGEHIRRVKGFTHILAKQVMKDWPEYNLTKEKVDLMASASALHDIGKIMIPDAILLKPGRLTPQEFDVMKTHTVNGCELLKKAPKDWSAYYLETSMDICRYHHEKYDGKGYPDGLVGDEIPISAQIVSVADCYDALTAKRVYKDAFSSDVAFDMITGGQCGAFSSKLMSSFLKCREQFTDVQLLSNLPDYAIMPVTVNEKLSQYNILFVEDNEMSRMIGREMLEGEGATVVEAMNGQNALDLFVQSAPGSFDAIVMDVNMPVMDGPTTTKEIRALGKERPDAAKIPIIALTASEEVQDLQRCLEAGMDGYLSKPVKISELTEILLRMGKKN